MCFAGAPGGRIVRARGRKRDEQDRDELPERQNASPAEKSCGSETLVSKREQSIVQPAFTDEFAMQRLSSVANMLGTHLRVRFRK